MGFFGKLFEKKNCDICDGEIGLLGNRKLEDGNLCKNCAKKLSPWFSERRQSTVEEIRQQLAYREENRAKLASFRPTRTMGERMKVYVDEASGLFAVTDSRNFNEDNPDLISLKDFVSGRLDVDSDQREITREENGNQVSYNPPRYEFTYEFRMHIHVNHPYFNEISFRLNNSTVRLVSEAPTVFGRGSLSQLLDGGVRNGFDPSYSIEYRNYKQMGDEIIATLQQGAQVWRGGGFQQQPMAGGYQQPPMGGGYQQGGYQQQPMGGGYQQAPMGGYPQGGFQQQPMGGYQQPMAGQGAPASGSWTCPSCGGQNSGRFCESCGAPKP